MRECWLTLRRENSSRNCSCYGCEQRFAFNGARPVDASFRAESACGWHGLCCGLSEENGKPLVDTVCEEVLEAHPFAGWFLSGHS